MAIYDDAIATIEAANGADPNQEICDGKAWPKELVYGRRMSAWLERLAPNASDALRLAARAQHIERWHIPRGDFEDGKKGYHLWRTTLYRYHAERAGALLTAVGYGSDIVERVGQLLQKKYLRSDPEAQTLEDAACLVFLENHFAEFVDKFDDKYDDAKIVDIVQKTWAKMSENGHKAALGLVGQLPDRARALVETALAGKA
jgi:hypothetical protein